MIAALGVTLAVLLGFAALAVDVANGYVVRGILQHAVDDAAVTAQRWSAQVDDVGVDPGTVQAQAVAAAIAVAQRDVQAHGLGGVTAVDAAVAGSRLRIAARASVRTWFLQALGITTWLPSASSEVALWTPASPPGTAGPIPAATLPEGPAGTGGAQQGDAAPGPGSSNGSSGAASDSPAPSGGGDIMEGP
jgi:Flp pilus assembly protein TadG